jgi:uncharacterized protein
MDGSDKGDSSSAAQYKMVVEKDVYVTMRDGVRIAICIFRPDGDGAFPALFAASPYQYEYDDVPAYSIFPWRETGPVEWYVNQGYAYVHMDVRGSGRSEGAFGFMGKTEQEDYCEVIEWIAKQPWCNERIGGIGQSYYAMAQWFMAAMNPPALKCIIPYDGLVDHYRGSVYHGGIFCSYRPGWYIGLLANNQHRPGNEPKRPRMECDLVGDIIGHPTYDDYWKERSAYERLKDIKIPVLSIGHWGKMGLHLRGNVLGYEELESPKKLVITGAKNVHDAHHWFDSIDFHEKEMLPFYDYHLKGIDNGVMNEPPVRIFVRGDEEYREEPKWPLDRAEYKPWYLRKGPSESLTSLNDGGLSTEPPSDGEGATEYNYPDAGWRMGVIGMGPDGRPDPIRRVLTYTSAPLKEDLEVTGSIILQLMASSDQIDTRFIVKLADQDPRTPADAEANRQPTSVNVSKGWLQASHREKDPERSTDLRPYYKHDMPEPIEPGKVYQYDIEVLPCSYVFKKGHRIRLEISNGDSGLTDAVFQHPYHPSLVGTDSIWHDAVHASRILLPVIPR